MNVRVMRIPLAAGLVVVAVTTARTVPADAPTSIPFSVDKDTAFTVLTNPTNRRYAMLINMAPAEGLQGGVLSLRRITTPGGPESDLPWTVSSGNAIVWDTVDSQVSVIAKTLFSSETG